MGKRTVAWGFENEERFFRAFSGKLANAPPWFVSVRRATPYEDRKRGFDAFVMTRDIGEIPVQIKSSVQGVLRFFRKHPRSSAAVVIVRAGLSSEAIRKRVFYAVGKRREML